MPTPTATWRIVDDLPTTDDRLGFCDYVQALHKVITSKETRTPLTIGIYGEWGAGKTSLMRQLEACLTDRETCKCEGVTMSSSETYWTVWFDAWKYGERVTLWRALLLQVLGTLKEKVEGKCSQQSKDAPDNGQNSSKKSQKASKACQKDKQQIDDLMKALYRPVEREEHGQITVDWQLLGKGAVDIALRMLPPVHGASKVITDIIANLRKDARQHDSRDSIEQILSAFQRETIKVFVEHIQFLEQFQKKFKDVLDKDYIPRVVIFIDDLDRCLPEQTIEVLESLKLFLDAEKCVFVLALDDTLVSQAVEVHYRQFLNRGGIAEGEERDERVKEESIRYLEKMIQLPFQLPPIDSETMESFIRFLLGEEAERRKKGKRKRKSKKDNLSIVKVFSEGLGNNPRQVKRAVNALSLLLQLAEVKQLSIEPVLLAKIIVIQSKMRDLYKFLLKHPSYIHDLEKHLEETVKAGRKSVEEGRTTTPTPLPNELSGYWKGPGAESVRKVLLLSEENKREKFGSLEEHELREYFTLTHYSPAFSSASEKITEKEPFQIPEMVPIDSKGEKFHISKYPITNEQYQAFVQETSHPSPTYWDGNVYPEGKAQHPVVGVSMKDVQAYCKWLGQKTGEQYILPTQRQWQLAAQGEKEQCYPWGNSFDKEKCNTLEGWQSKEKSTTTPVGKYSPEGDSRWGCADMIGNVWEWTRTCSREEKGGEKDAWDFTEKDRLVLCGGSFASKGKDLCIKKEGCRKTQEPLTVSPAARFKDLGFRIVQLPTGVRETRG